MQLTKPILPIAFLLLCLSIGCERTNTIDTLIAPSKGDTEEILIIGPYTETCQGFIEQTCFLELNEETQEWELFYESIQGFDYEPGYIWTLKVRLEDRGLEIQDIGRYAYHLVEVVSQKEASSDSLSIALRSHR